MKVDIAANEIDKIIDLLQLDLKGKIVLTEAATGPYAVTPIIASKAGAKVFAFTKSTRYGTTEDVINQTNFLINYFSADKSQIEIIETLQAEIIGMADIITNSGHLRPLNETILKYAKQGVVIPTMYEKWELRESDIDIATCQLLKIKVAATNEFHPLVDIFSFIPGLISKMVLDAHININRQRCIILCNNEFGSYIARALLHSCEKIGVIDKPENKDNYKGMWNVEFLSEFPKIEIPEDFQKSKAVFFALHPFNRDWMSATGFFNATLFNNKLNNWKLMRVAGDIDTDYCEQCGISYFPDKLDKGQMGILPSDLGFEPVIKLQAAGLKVAEELLRKNYDSEFLNMVC